MKRLKKSTKAIIISICVAVIAAAGVLTAVLLGKDKPGNPPVTPQTPPVVYTLTEDQKAFGLQVNDSYKEYANSKKSVFYDLTAAQLTSTGFTMEQIVSYDGKYLVASADGRTKSVFVYENNNFVSLVSKLDSNSLLASEDVSNVVVEKVVDGFVVLSQTYVVETTTYMDYHVVCLGNTISVSKTFSTTLKDVGGEIYNFIGEEMFGFIPNNEFFMTLYADSTATNQSFYLYEYTTDYTSYEPFALEDVEISSIENFVPNDNPVVVEFFDADDLLIYYSKKDGFYTNELTPTYDSVTNYANVTLFENGTHGSTEEHRIHVETEHNGYFVSYSYEIKVGEDEKTNFVLDKTYSKITLLLATDEYFGVLAQDTDENDKLLDGGKYIYFDYDMNIIAEYEAETSNATLLFSASNKYFTNEGVYAAENQVKLNKVFDYLTFGYSFDSVNDNFTRVTLKQDTSLIFFDIETLFVDETSYAEYVRLDKNYYYVGNSDGTYILDETGESAVKTPISVADVTYSNLNLLETYSLYFRNNESQGIDLYFGKSKLYPSVSNIETTLETVRFTSGGEYRILYLKNILVSVDNGGSGSGEEEVENVSFPISDSECDVENYALTELEYLGESMVGNYSSKSYRWYFSDGYYPVQYTVFSLWINRNNNVGEKLKIPFKISVNSSGWMSVSLYGCNYYSTVYKSGALWWTSDYYDKFNVQGANKNNHDWSESYKILFVPCTDYYHNNNVGYSCSYGANSSGLYIDFSVWETNTSHGNTISSVATGHWIEPKNQYNAHNETYSSRLYYTVETRFVKTENADYVDLLTTNSSSTNSTYGSYYYDSVKYYLDKSASLIRVSSWSSNTTYAVRNIKGGRFVGITKPDTHLTKSYSDIYSTTSRTYSASIITGSISENRSGRYRYISIGNNAQYLFKDGWLNYKRIVYTVFEPIDVKVKVNFKTSGDDGVVTSESPSVKGQIYKGSSGTTADGGSFNISHGTQFTMKYSKWLQISISSKHYNISHWTIANTTNSSHSGNMAVSTKFTKLNNSDSQIVEITAHWTEKSYVTYGRMWTKEGKDYKVYLYDEQTDRIKTSMVPVNVTDAAPLYKKGGNDMYVNKFGYITATNSLTGINASIISFDFSDTHTFASLYDNNLDSAYKSISCNGAYEFYGWAILRRDETSPRTTAFFPKSFNPSGTDSNNSGDKIFGKFQDYDNYEDACVFENTYMVLVAIYKPKPSTIVVDYEDIGGSLTLKTGKDNISKKTYTSTTGNVETVNNLFNDAAINPNYKIKIVRQNTSATVYNSGVKGNTGTDLLCGDNISFQVTLHSSYYVTKFVLTNYILAASDKKYYDNTVTITYDRASKVWSYAISGTHGKSFTKKTDASGYVYFGDSAVNLLKVSISGTNTVNLEIKTLANPNGNLENNTGALTNSGSATLSGQKGIVVKFFGNSVTSNDNDIIIKDATQTSGTIANHRSDNTALELASQPLIFENSDKTAYFWYNMKKYYLIENTTTAFNKYGEEVEKFYKFKSGVTGYSANDSTYTNFLTQTDTSTEIICYLQRIYDTAGNVKFNVIYPAKYFGNTLTTAAVGHSLNNYWFDTSISYNNTRMIAISPYQTKVYESAKPSHVSTNGATPPSTTSIYYELNAYVSGIILGANETLFSFDVPTRNLTGSGILTQDYFNLRMNSNSATQIAGLSGTIFKYLGEDYIIHDAYKSKNSSGNYYLYFARRTSDHLTMYFMVYDRFYTGTVGLNDDKSTAITVNIAKLSYELVIDDISDESDNFSLGSTIDNKLNVYKTKTDDCLIFDGVNGSVIKTNQKFSLDKASEEKPYEYYASNNNRFVFIPASGYMIYTFSLSVRTVGSFIPIFSFTLNQDTSFNNLYRADGSGEYYYTYTTSDGSTITSNLLYQMPHNNVIASDIANSGYLGSYYTYNGVNDWETNISPSGTYNFNQLFVMISGIYGDVNIEIELISYAELIFEPEEEGENGIIGTIPGSASNIIDYDLSNSKLDIFAIKNKGSSTAPNIEKIEPISSSDAFAKLYTSNNNNIMKGTLRVIFLGKASVIKYGLKIVASGEDYSYSFTNGTFYLSPTTNAFQYLDEYSGRTIGDAPIDPASRQKTDQLVYMGIGTGPTSKLRDFFDNYSINDYYEPYRPSFQNNEANTKFLLAVKVLKNTTKITTNSYLYNKNLEPTGSNVNDYTGTYTAGYSYQEDIHSTKISLNGLGFSDIQTYQLDNTEKSQSWFNNTVLSNLEIINGVSSVNWQNGSVYKREGAGEIKGNQFKVNGYGLTYKYNEIPGYYLEYISVRIAEHGMVLFKVTDIITTGKLSANVSLKSFAGTAHDQEQYTITVVYDGFNSNYDSDGTFDQESRFTINLYKKALPGKSAERTDNIYSVGILANNVTIDFLSRPYTYRVIYNMFDFTLNGENQSIFSSYSARSITAPAKNEQKSIYYQNIEYDTLTNLTATATMPGYTFIGWGSQNYYVYDESTSKYIYSPRQVYHGQSSHLTTWNSSSSWLTAIDFFDYENRSALFSLNKMYSDSKSGLRAALPGSSFYTSGAKFITDTGFATEGEESRTASLPIENYNFWIEYVNTFMATVGKYTSYTTGLTPNWKTDSNGKYTDVRNIELYGIWKANTYALKFELNTLEDESVVYLDYKNTGTFKNDILLSNKLGFYNGAQAYYAYVTFDTNLWYVTTDPNYSYTASAISIAEGNMLDLVVDRYGYSWLGWFSKGQGAEIRQHEVKLDTIEALSGMPIAATFASTYYNKMVNPAGQATIPTFTYTMYRNNGLDDSLFNTNKFTVLDQNNNTDYNIAYYDYSKYDTSTDILNVLTVEYTNLSGVSQVFAVSGYKGIIKTKDYLNVSVSENSTYKIGNVNVNYFLTYYDTALSAQSYKVDSGNLVIDKGAGLREFCLYAYWQTNLYNLIFDWQDNNNASASLNHLGSTKSETLSISDTQGLKYHFYDTTLDEFLRGLVPYREGYDFIGWTFNYIPASSTTYADKIASINTPTSIFYLCQDLFTTSQSLEGIVATNYSNTLYSIDNRITTWSSDDSSWLLTNSGSERLGNDWVDNDEEKHYVYIFALWTAQTFSINVSLNIEKEQLENLYEIDSDFALGLYNDNLSSYTGISSNNYMYNDVIFNDIVANIAFEIEFDQTFKNVLDDDSESRRDGAKLTFANKTFYIDDLFATSAGYYFLGLMIDNEYTDDNSYIVKNTLKTIWLESDLSHANSSGEIKYYGGSSYGNNPVLDHDMYHKLHVTNHKIIPGSQTTNLEQNNYDNLANQKTTSHTTDYLYSGVDFIAQTKVLSSDRTRYGSTNFGSLTFNGKTYFVNSEAVETNTGTEYYLYILINGNRYYVVYYQYVSDAAGGSIDSITADRTFLYYNDSATGQKYKIHFAYNEDCTKYTAYYVTNNFADRVDGTNPNGRTDIKLRFALYTTKTNVVSTMTGAQSTTIDPGLLAYQYDVATSNYETGNIMLDGVSARFNISSFTTRQFTVYAHWENKNLNVVLNNSSGSNVGSSSANNGLTGYYNVQNLTDKKNQTYANYSVSNRPTDSAVTKGVEENGDRVANLQYTYNYYDSLEFLILPYYNGRYLSEMTFEFDDLREIKDTDPESINFGSSTFAKITRSITFKFQYNSDTRTVTVSQNGITSSFITPSYVNVDGNKIESSYSNKASVDYYGYKYTDYIFTQTSYLSIIDQDSLSCSLNEDGQTLDGYDKTSYGGGGIRVFEYLGLKDDGETYNKIKQRTNVNAVNFKLDNIMSSINIKFKFSVQTYQVNLYSVANQAGDGLIKTEDQYEEHYYSEAYKTLDDVKKDSNATAAKIPLLGAPYKSSSGYTRTNIATIKSDCSDATSISYNLPYGYYLYGIGYNLDAKPYRPIDTVAYPSDPYYGFNYLYGQGNYNFGSTETEIKGPAGDLYSRQCSAALGSSQLVEAKGIRLTNLASYAFSGWYEIIDDGNADNYYTPKGKTDSYVVFNEYSKTDEATYIDRNLDLYGYYYDSDNSKSVQFYYWDNDAEMYMLYTENQDIYTLSNTINTSGYKVVDNVLIMDNEKQDVERTTLHKFGSTEIELSILNIYTKFGADTEAFNTALYTEHEFMNDPNDKHVLDAVVDTYWFYYVKYDFMYIEVGASKVKYFAREDSLNGSDVTFCFVNENNPNEILYPNSKIEINNSVGGRTYRTHTSGGDFDVHLMTQVCKQGTYKKGEDTIRYDYDFNGSNLYVYYQDRYYKLNERVATSNNKARYEVRILDKTYYLITGRTDTSNSNASLLYRFASGTYLAADIAGYKIVGLKNYLVDCDDKYYPIVYPEFVDSGGATYVNPYKYTKSNKADITFLNTLSVPVEVAEDTYVYTTLYFDYETGILYTDERFVNKASSDVYKVYSPLNENFTMNVGSNGSGYAISSVNLTKLPSNNSSEWYNDIRYGFVCYINVDDSIIQRISTIGETTGIYATFRDYIYSTENTTFDGFEAQAMEDLTVNLVDYQDSQKFFTTFITVEEYEFATDGKTIIKVVANLYVQFKFFYYVTDTESGQLVKGEPVYVTLLCPYTFDVISDDTVIDETLYAIPIFAPFVVEFTKNTATLGGASGCEATIDVNKMEVSYFEVTSESVTVYDRDNGNILQFAVLTENQYNELINAPTGDYASNLNLLVKGGHCPVFDELNPVYDLNTIDIKTEIDGIYQDIYLLAFYYKEGKDYIVRVSDNSLKFNMTMENEANRVVSTVVVKMP